VSLTAPNSNVVAAACDALRVLTLATWRPPRGVPLKRPTLKDFVLEMHLGAAPSKEGRKAVKLKYEMSL
jgi:hypothetical protein